MNDKSDREKEIKYGDVLEGEKDADLFYIVDVSGFGFAQVPEKQRLDWSSSLSISRYEKYLESGISSRGWSCVYYHFISIRISGLICSHDQCLRTINLI